ncbi:ubiquinol-cytochrome c reductase iron-sulfur subunit [Haloechinothrix salitolerans]|uniref:Cytochrome bc1 complex Rieske iron-sulfur subunit n=1 Tax=Haloechinothrix salitolerans TaxID=926830 RepID=A0ABW2C2Z4_9PSEU
MGGSGDDERPGASAQEADGKDLFRLGTQRDDVELRRYEYPWPEPGTRAEKRARRHVLYWWALTVVSGITAAVVYLAWPWQYVPPGGGGHTWYVLYTPVLGLSIGVALVSFAFGFIVLVKRFFPEEQAVQQRHDAEHSPAEDRATLAATAAEAANASGLRRRSVFTRAAGLGVGALGTGLGVTILGGVVHNPWDTTGLNESAKDTLWRTGWKPVAGETVYLRADSGDPHEVILVRPEDLGAPGIMSVVPFRESERDNPEMLSKARHRADNPATLLRLPPRTEVAPKAGREGMNVGDFYAYSRVCTHLGCPVTMYEGRTDRLFCPCHQSMFDLREHAKPIFGPATRALPQLPIDLDESGYFVATGDFTAPIGPSFWELEP